LQKLDNYLYSTDQTLIKIKIKVPPKMGKVNRKAKKKKKMKKAKGRKGGRKLLNGFNCH